MNAARVLVTQTRDKAEALNAFFTSVFIGKTHLQASKILQKGRLVLCEIGSSRRMLKQTDEMHS